MRLSLIFLTILLLQACDFSKRIDTRAAVKELKERQVKRVLPQQLVDQVDRWGQEVQKQLMDLYAQEKASPRVLDSLAQRFDIRIQSGAPLDLMKAQSDPKIKATLDALAYSLENKIPVEPSIQKTQTGDSLYYFFAQSPKACTVLGFGKVRVIQRMDLPLIK